MCKCNNYYRTEVVYLLILLIKKRKIAIYLSNPYEQNVTGVQFFK